MITSLDKLMMKKDVQTKILDWAVPILLKTNISYSASDELGATLSSTSTSIDYTINGIVHNKAELLQGYSDNKSKLFLPEGIIEQVEYFVFCSIQDIEQLGITLSLKDILVYNGIEYYIKHISKNRHEYSIAIGLKK